MAKRIQVAAHLSVEELEKHYRQAKDGVERADVAQKGKSERPDWMKKRAAHRHKTLVVCLECHHKIQYGRYDGKALSC